MQERERWRVRESEGGREIARERGERERVGERERESELEREIVGEKE